LAHTVTASKVPKWTALLGLALFGLALFWLHHLLGQYRWSDVLAHVHAIPTAKVLRAALFTVLGYGCLTLYDALAVRFAGAHVPYPRIALISFMGYAIGHNVGLNTLSGGAIRYRAYTALGLGAKQIATIIAFGSVTFLLGAGLLLGLSLLTQAGMSQSVLNMHASLSMAAGAVLLATVAAYLCLVCTRHEPLKIWRMAIPVPKPCAGRRGMRRSIVRGERAVCVAAAAGGNELRGICRGLSDCHCRGRDQQRAGRHRSVRSGTALAAALSAEGQPAGRSGRLPCHLLFCPVRRRARPAGRA